LINAWFIGKEATRWPGPGTHLPEGLFKNIDGPDGRPYVFLKRIVAGAAEIFLYALDSPLLLHKLLGFGFSRASDDLLVVVSREDELDPL